MKKNCNNCKALLKKTTKIGCYCGLDHEIKVTTQIDDIPVGYKPAEDCEKPLTYNDFLNCM